MKSKRNQTIVMDLEDQIDEKEDKFYGYTGIVTVGDGYGGTLNLVIGNGIILDVI